ncbi:MAG TPA: hypothetical protein VJ180_11945 [Pyrinomonadaceae bacterium]|nr:hypothetical protein [Pyrinomonadaceae bacterium]
MKKKQTPKHRKSVPNDMRPEYRFNYSKARPNRFASRAGQPPLVVLVEPDVAKVFTTGESVNRALRALITALPKAAGSKSLSR